MAKKLELTDISQVLYTHSIILISTDFRISVIALNCLMYCQKRSFYRRHATIRRYSINPYYVLLDDPAVNVAGLLRDVHADLNYRLLV